MVRKKATRQEVIKMHPVFIQAFYYAIVMIFCFAAVGTIQRGFWWRYMRVRTSFGKYVMVKIRTPLRDHYATGWVDENFLCYKTKDETGKFTIRISINTSDRIFYRSMAITWIDVDDEKHAICKADYSSVEGFDAKKHSDLHTRALMRPAVNSTQEKIILFGVIVAVILSAASAYLSYMTYAYMQQFYTELPGMLASATSKALIIGSNTVI